MAKKATQASSSGKAAHRRSKKFWLVKSEPDEFSIDDLETSKEQTTCWDGVRNYQARNTLRDDMKVGDLVLFYHSNADPPGIAGIVKVVRDGYPDHTAFDPQDKHFDPKSKKAEPKWFMVDVQLVEKFPRLLPLPELKKVPELEGMVLLQKGSRLSVQPVSEAHFKWIQKMARRK
jgi:predicted RNA-binding protein with PUA-like domain